MQDCLDNHPDEGEVVLHTDSMSALTILETASFRAYPEITTRIWEVAELFQARGTWLVLHWVPIATSALQATRPQTRPPTQPPQPQQSVTLQRILPGPRHRELVNRHFKDALIRHVRVRAADVLPPLVHRHHCT